MKFFLPWLLVATASRRRSRRTRENAPRWQSGVQFRCHAWSDDEATRHLPIGVFDSGIGGLTVLEALLTLDAFHNDTLQPGADGVADFAQERFIYFGDQANMPYGNYSAVQRTDYLRELIVKDADLPPRPPILAC
jgi:hypothetical protein